LALFNDFIIFCFSFLNFNVNRSRPTWLNAYHDPVAGLRAFSQNIRLADVHGDGEFRLLVADVDKKLKVFKS
jgi:hypothetical protein